MLGKPWRLSMHAATVALERGISLSWIESAISRPDWTAPDPVDASLTRHFLGITENGGRVLRVVVKESASETLVVTVFFDRDARRPL